MGDRKKLEKGPNLLLQQKQTFGIMRLDGRATIVEVVDGDEKVVEGVG